MKQEELLKPRIKLTAPIPFFENKVGEILEVTDQGVFLDPDFDEQSSFCIIWEDVPKYPHLFKKLEWWEEIDKKDLPEYVKLINGKICKVTQYFNFNMIEIIMDGKTRNCRLKNSLPATEEEYNTQNK